MAALTVPADIVLHENHDWRGIFRERDGGQLRIDAHLNPLFVTAQELNVVKPLSGFASMMAATLIMMLQQKVYEWEERLLVLPLVQVRLPEGAFVVGAPALLAPQRKLRWMFVRITEGARNDLLVWLDSQLEQGRLKA